MRRETTALLQMRRLDYFGLVRYFYKEFVKVLFILATGLSHYAAAKASIFDNQRKHGAAPGRPVGAHYCFSSSLFTRRPS